MEMSVTPISSNKLAAQRDWGFGQLDSTQLITTLSSAHRGLSFELSAQPSAAYRTSQHRCLHTCM